MKRRRCRSLGCPVANQKARLCPEARLEQHEKEQQQPQGMSRCASDNRLPQVLRRVYPEVRNHEFKAEFRFAGDIPENLRSGQTCRLEVRLGASRESVLVPRGAFFQSTGGSWIFVLDPDGKGAHRREVRIGRQNPEYYEVLEGLAPGERVVLDGYEGLGKCDELRFRQ